MKIVLATTNKGKIEEFKKLFETLDIQILSQDDFEVHNIVENGNSFEENSLIKAKIVSEISKLPTIADDSGLCIEALDNKPGIHTARYFEEAKDYNEKCKKMIKLLDDTKSENRKAKFVSVITMYYPNGEYFIFRGEANGEIFKEPTGNLGHAYDPIFYSYDLKKGFAEVSIEEKNIVSHRAKAFKKLKEYILSLNG